MGSEIQRLRGSNLGLPVQMGLGQVVVVASKATTPLAIGGLAAAAEVLYNNTATTPSFIQHVPVLGGVVDSAFNFMGGIENTPVIGGAVEVGLAGGAAFLAYKYLGKPLQRAAQRTVQKHGLA